MSSFMGRLGNREGINVAKVDVSMYTEGGYDGERREPDTIEHGHYIVHAVGDEPEIAAEGEYGSIYTVFEGRVHAAMQAKVEAGKFDSYEIEDISAI